VHEHANAAAVNDDLVRRVAVLAQRAIGKQTVHQAISRDDDLHTQGLSSLGLVNLMLAVEEEFDVKVPDRDMTPVNFRTIARIAELVRTLSAI
jgi:acyl carrier protein